MSHCLNNELSRLEPEIASREGSASQGAEIFVKNPDDYAAYLQADAKLMLELIKAAHMTAN